MDIWNNLSVIPVGEMIAIYVIVQMVESIALTMLMWMCMVWIIHSIYLRSRRLDK